MLSDIPEILRNSFGIGGFVGIHCCGSCHFSRRTHLQALLEAQEFIHGRCTPMYRCSAASEMMYRHTHTHCTFWSFCLHSNCVYNICCIYYRIYIYHFISSIYNPSYHIYSYLSLTLSLMTNYTRKLFYISYCYYTEINVGIRWFYEHAGYVGVQTQNAYNI